MTPEPPPPAPEDPAEKFLRELEDHFYGDKPPALTPTQPPPQRTD